MIIKFHWKISNNRTYIQDAVFKAFAVYLKHVISTRNLTYISGKKYVLYLKYIIIEYSNSELYVCIDIIFFLLLRCDEPFKKKQDFRYLFNKLY